MIYVDSNVPMYLVGRDHPNKPRVIELVSRFISAREALVTSAETFQEIIHRYMALRDREALALAYDALESMVRITVDVTKEDVDAARAASGNYPALSSRDCLHLAVMKRTGCTTIWTYDTGFRAVPTLEVVN